MGTVECTLAEVIAAKGRFQRGLSPYIETPGDCGILVKFYSKASMVTIKITETVECGYCDLYDTKLLCLWQMVVIRMPNDEFKLR